MKYKEIKFLKNAKNFEVVTGGYSGAEKYSFYKKGKKYFLKIGEFKICENLESLLNENEIPHPKIVLCGQLDKEKNYIIEEYSEGTDLKEELNNYDSKFIYEFGFKIGKQYGKLREKYPDKPLSKAYIMDHKKTALERVENLRTEYKRRKCRLKKEEKSIIAFTVDYLENNFDAFKKSKLVFGHCDIKPSNFLLHKKTVIATDIEHIDYKEISLSMLWSYARNDNNDDKNFAFTKGYLDGLYNLDVPRNVLNAFNYTFMYNMAHYMIDYLKNEKYDKLNILIEHLNKLYIVDGKVVIDKYLKSPANIKNFPKLKGYDFTLVKGSYSPDNFTFKCTLKNDNIFLKIMKMNEKRFKKIKKCYKILANCGIPTSPVRFSGTINKDEIYYVAFNFIDFKEMAEDNKNLNFEDGLKYGELVASYLKKLKGQHYEEISAYKKEELYRDVINCADAIYKFPEYGKYLKWTKEKLIAYLDHYIEFFNDEPIDLIHADVKFGNILYDGKKGLVFVDNESLKYSFDTINFLYNIQNGFKYKTINLYRGFVVGYLKYMNGGTIPNRIEGQVKFLLMYYLLREILGALKNIGKDNELVDYMNICEEYIGKDKKIEWLK